MPMTVTITIESREDIVLFSRWASLGRTFDSTERGLHQALDANPDDDQTKVALEEIQSLHRPLEKLHTAIRDEMWKQACLTFVKEQLGHKYLCRLEKGHAGPCRAF